jgi:hypothetical protein
MDEAAKSSLFKTRITPRDKAEQTTIAARSIMDAEVVAREKKTARLRELRLAHEAEELAKAPAPPAAGKPRVKAK